MCIHKRKARQVAMCTPAIALLLCRPFDLGGHRFKSSELGFALWPKLLAIRVYRSAFLDLSRLRGGRAGSSQGCR
jgi:hypothetical protein